MRFPVRLRHRGAKVVIYGKSASYGYYRLAFKSAGKRIVRSYPTYSEALKEAERVVRELASGNQASGLTARETADLLAVRGALADFRRTTGRDANLIGAVTGYLGAVRRLPETVVLGEVVDAYLAGAGLLKPIALSETVEEFIKGREHKTEAKDGQRPALSPVYEYNVAMWLREFAGTFPATKIGQLTREHLGLWIGRFSKLSAKSRNDRRAAVRMLLGWAARHDYLGTNNRLFQAEALVAERVDHGEIDFYRPPELRAMLEASEGPLRAAIALQGLAGLRREEVFRLRWDDVWRVPGHVEISARMAKTRQRRLVEVCLALGAWLAPFEEMTGPVWPQSPDAFEEATTALRKTCNVPARRNGWRHAFVTFHFALHQNENLTAAMAGNTPAMVHQCYKGLATKAEAEKWFAVAPAQAANVIAMLPATRPAAAS